MSIISKAYAEGAVPGAQSSGMEMIIMLAVFGLIFYFMIYRPQAKRAKDHRNLMSSLSKGDEVLTSGGLVGKIAKVSADSEYLVLALNDQTQVTIKRDFVSAVLPKGSIQSL
ncbi:TPA: preprotein translocase subunit YajC [Aeromonas hydrophila]|uniref:preprotein translocase subunit YajC n=1 Tax=Aeromonas TaxID=642 RepID=UPI0005D8482C|nr:preprotein translocase subunit YajC [Aeromonas hydrophila]AKA17877.1 preprotein translocase subunit YajC [Aeromonas hydrophila]MBW3798718.1 preprotein translocase subunit YajC [Aeromonas hydrophila]MBW3801101.1 preprotein translocase subunit YajC [Aeromonas hydrophila]MBW3817537.1 preprotein translocase subunit YajC [Aeromonas hydrophila]MBW3843074.1 preprotein translocase subunit YajC [Aeromonas hydrophila]